MIIITGANGLLGQYIARKFIAEGKSVAGLKRADSDLALLKDVGSQISWRDGDVTDPASLLDAFAGADTVIHAAAMVSFDPRQKEKIHDVNVEGTRHVVNTCLRLNIRRLIFISSVAALGRSKGLTTINEQTPWAESDLNSDYGQSKYEAELEVYRGQEEGLSVSIVCPSVILAPADLKKSSAQIFGYVMRERNFYSDALINYVDVRDVAEMVYRLYASNKNGERFIASAGAVSMKNLLEEIAVRLGKRKPNRLIHTRWLKVAAWLEELRCRLTGDEMLISRQSVKAGQEKYIYQNDRSVRELDIHYRSRSETLDWCCDYYRHLL